MVRYGGGSGFFRTMVTAPHVAGGSALVVLFRIFMAMLLRPILTLRTLFVSDWARATMILLYMRSTEGTLRFVRNRFGFMNTRVERGERPSASIPEATELAFRIAEVTVKLFFREAGDALGFLLFTQTAAVFGHLDALLHMHARRRLARAFFEDAGVVALLAF